LSISTPSRQWRNHSRRSCLRNRSKFTRTHDLVKLARLLGDQGIVLPVKEEQLRRLNPFAVAFRYDDMEIAPVAQEGMTSLIAEIRRWAEAEVRAATKREESYGPDEH